MSQGGASSKKNKPPKKGGTSTALIVVPQPKQQEQEAPKAKSGVTNKEFNNLEKESGIKFSPALRKYLGNDLAYEQLNDVVNVFGEFGLKASDYVPMVKAMRLGAGVMGSTTRGDGTPIKLSSDYFKDPTSMSVAYEYDVFKKFHPQNTTWKEIITHEAGHRLEEALADRILKKGVLPDGSPSNDWYTVKLGRSGTKSIVQMAVQNLQKTSYGSGKSEKELRQMLSGYSYPKYPETFAEATADWYRNRDKANPLSKEIIRIFKEYMS